MIEKTTKLIKNPDEIVPVSYQSPQPKDSRHTNRKTFTEHDANSNKSENFMDKGFLSVEEKDFNDNKSDIGGQGNNEAQLENLRNS